MQIFRNFIKPFRYPPFVFAYIGFIIVGFLLWWNFTNVKIMFGNYGKIHTYLDVGLSMGVILLFPLLLIGIIYKGYNFGPKENLNPQNGVGLVSGIIGTIISGSSCCGLTLASYFGLLPLLDVLPYTGIEIKILGFIGLNWAIWDLYAHIDECRIKRPLWKRILRIKK